MILEKYHGLGNDYLVYDPNRQGAGGTSADGAMCGQGDILCADGAGINAEAVRLVCDRNYGIGGDGILYGPVAAVGGRPGVRIFNPDGGEAEKSGNGVRIFAKYLRDAGYVRERSFTLSTRGGDVTVEYLTEDGGMMKVMMGVPTFNSAKIPVLPDGPEREVVGEPLIFGGVTYRATCVSVGNPHCVIPMDEVSKETALALGPLVESAPYFPNRTNVQFLKVLDRANIRIEIYERGAGYTLASGSSSCAAASAAWRLGLTDEKMTVHMPGGRLDIHIDPADGRIYMTGPVSRVGTFSASAEFMTELRRKAPRSSAPRSSAFPSTGPPAPQVRGTRPPAPPASDNAPRCA